MTGTVTFEDAATPAGMRLVAIGDIHGRRDLLARLLDAIESEIEADRPGDWRILTLGDYVDRGQDSRGVIDMLVARRRAPRFITLAGNHDDGFLAFLANEDLQSVFIAHGGAETAVSYGVTLDATSEASLAHARRSLASAMPAHHVEFLGSLGVSATFGDFFFCHAGIRPGVPLDAQTRQDLTWIRREFIDHDGFHPKLIVHGHTPKPEPEILPNRVNIDTRAYSTGVLSAFIADGRSKWLLQANGTEVVRTEIGTR